MYVRMSEQGARGERTHAGGSIDLALPPRRGLRHHRFLRKQPSVGSEIVTGMSEGGGRR
jgi:hypothetical protein